ncbi:outer membrane efflux protein [Caballeronia sordidicola]|uniref:Outer membrane efflux protein n=1 Tax=Caballeronia sordidicola TaxID=196367 RepID=A0A158HLF9_CABSO|nr:efflux transporter outer membrane subunit [Caballeronia sordidicola]SAL45096.1 outer membrane efflux protein [Caballeronia sordidicola]
MKNWTAGFALLALTGCSVTAPDSHPVSIPSTWQYAASDHHGIPINKDWWTVFGSTELDHLIRDTNHDSFDIAAAVARVRQAQATARIAGTPLLPTVSGFADASRQSGLLVSDTELEGTSFDLGLAASYELDFWGRNRAIRNAAIDTLRASRFDRDTVALTVSADVTNTWLQTVALRERSDVARQNLETAGAIRDTVESQFRAGAATQLDVHQQRAAVAAQRRAVESLAQQTNDSLATLAVLLGKPVSQLQLTTQSLAGLHMPDVDAGVPSDVLVQRPDLARAEAQLAAADADIIAARAAMLPSLTLTATVGSGGGGQIHTLLDNSLYSVAAGLTAPIFNAGALAAGRDLAVAQKEELLATYHAAIITALGDVERSLNAVQGLDSQFKTNDEELG